MSERENRVAQPPSAVVRTEHTPGPWTYEATTLPIVKLIVTPEEVHAFRVFPEANRDHAIAYVPSDYGNDQTDYCKEQEANARFIAHVPEMLAALKAVRALFAGPFYIRKLGGRITNADQELIDRAFIAVDAAIAKAQVQP